MACSVPELDGKDQGEDGPKQACSFWFVSFSLPVTSGANLCPPFVLVFLCHIAFLWSYIFIYFFAFVFFAFIDSAALLRSTILRYA